MENKTIQFITASIVIIIAVLVVIFVPLDGCFIKIHLDNEDVCLSKDEYLQAKEVLFDKYRNKETFTREEWLYFAGIVNNEIKEEGGTEIENFEGENIIGETINAVE